MPTSDKQIAANRRNAEQSTGPRTPEGKQAVRHNALKHGILARETIIAWRDYQEDADEFEALLAQVYDELQPEGTLADLLVQQIAICYWRLRRILRADAHEFAKIMERIRRPIPGEQPGELPILRSAEAIPPVPRLDAILRYEKTLQNELHRAQLHLERLQRQRRGETVPPPLTVQLTAEQ